MRRRRGAAAALAVMIAGLVGLASPVRPSAAAAERQRVILTFDSAERAAAGPALASTGGSARRLGPRALVLTATDEEAGALRNVPGVVSVEPDLPVHAEALPDDPCVTGCAGGAQWQIGATSLEAAWARTHGAGATIAVLDTGIDQAHPDLASKLLTPEVDETGLGDGAGAHGTAVAGIAAAVTDNGTGLAGVAWDARLLSYKVMSRDGNGFVSWVAAALYDAADHKADVVNLSLGSNIASQALADAVAYARARGAVVVAAAGNEATTAFEYPGALPGVISVGADTPSGTLAPFSNRGPWVDVTAPGVDLPSPAPGGGYQLFSGTSAAAPVVSGIIALVVARSGGAPADIESRLRDSAVPLADGRGARVDAAGAVGTFRPYGRFPGGAFVAQGDLDGDGTSEIVTGAGPGGGPHVRPFDGRGAPRGGGFFAYDAAFRGGASVAVGDVDHDGKAEIVTGAGPGGGPHVRVFRPDGEPQGGGFFAYDAAFRGGVSVAAGDVDGDGRDEIVTGAGPGGGPHVRALRGSGEAVGGGFFAYDPAFRGGVSVAVGDIDGDGADDIVTGALAGGGPDVRVFHGDGAPMAEFYAFAPTFRGGVSVAVADFDGDGRAEIVVGAGPGGGPEVRVLRGDGTPVTNTFAFSPGFGGGLRVSAAPDGYVASTASLDSMVQLVTR